MNIPTIVFVCIVSIALSQPCLRGEDGESVKRFTPIVEHDALINLIQDLNWRQIDLTWHTNGGDYYFKGPQIVISNYSGKWSMKYRDKIRYKEGKEITDNWEKSVFTKKQVEKFIKELTKYMAIAKNEIDFNESIKGLSKSEREAKIQKANNALGFGIPWFGYQLTLTQGGQQLNVGDMFSKTTLMNGWMMSLAPSRANN